MTFQAAAQFAQSQKLFIGNRADGFVGRVQQRASMAFGENQAVIVGVFRVIEIVAQVIGEQNAHQLGSAHRGCRMAGASGCRTANAVDAQLGGKFGVELCLFSCLNTLCFNGCHKKPSSVIILVSFHGLIAIVLS